MEEKIFLLRAPIPGSNDQAVVYGKIFFGIALFVGVFLRTFFLLTYFDSLVQKFWEVVFKAPKNAN